MAAKEQKKWCTAHCRHRQLGTELTTFYHLSPLNQLKLTWLKLPLIVPDTMSHQHSSFPPKNLQLKPDLPLAMCGSLSVCFSTRQCLLLPYMTKSMLLCQGFPSTDILYLSSRHNWDWSPPVQSGTAANRSHSCLPAFATHTCAPGTSLAQLHQQVNKKQKTWNVAGPVLLHFSDEIQRN